MVKYFLTGLVMVYTLLTSSLVLWTIFLCGLHLSTLHGIMMILAWGVICFASFYFQPLLLPFSQLNVRKSVLAEEEKMNKYLSEVLTSANYNGQIRLLIGEALTIDAFTAGQNTIVISRGALNNLTPGEIRAVIAHELGHVLSRDVLLLTAFATANLLPKTMALIGKYLIKFFRGFMSAGCLPVFASLIIIAALAFIFHLHHHMFSIAAVPGLIYLTGFLEPVFVVLWRMGSRFVEYKQDAFAWRLGYGNDLKSALYKISLKQTQAVNLFHILTTSTHPVIYNRIRRLEKMEGLR